MANLTILPGPRPFAVLDYQAILTQVGKRIGLTRNSAHGYHIYIYFLLYNIKIVYSILDTL
jgi:hypothetical protein